MRLLLLLGTASLLTACTLPLRGTAPQPPAPNSGATPKLPSGRLAKPPPKTTSIKPVDKPVPTWCG